MNDQQFLIWIHERLTQVHGESPTFDFMHKLRAIIKATDPDKLTPSMGVVNNIQDLKRDLGL